eukprot:8995348-Pyramimonas_sp.AAC.1
MEGTSNPILGIQDDGGIESPPPRSLETKDNLHRVMEGTEEGIVSIQAGAHAKHIREVEDNAQDMQKDMK